MKTNDRASTTEKPEIIDRGRGPEIKDTRITVYTILEYLIHAWDKHRIAALLNLRDNQVQAAIDYIDEHDLEVLREYVQILERIRAGNSPELQAKLNACHGSARELAKRIREAKVRGETDSQIHEMVQEFRVRWKRDHMKKTMEPDSCMIVEGREEFPT